jgi:uncharacterized membrane protein YfcA
MVQALMRITGYVALDFYGAGTLLLLASALPLVWIGAGIADRFSARINQQVFNRVVGAVLMVSGATLLLK